MPNELVNELRLFARFEDMGDPKSKLVSILNEAAAEIERLESKIAHCNGNHDECKCICQETSEPWQLKAIGIRYSRERERAEAAEAEIELLHKENRGLSAIVAAVEALAEKWEQEYGEEPEDAIFVACADELKAALEHNNDS